jgi:hypothetical protein
LLIKQQQVQQQQAEIRQLQQGLVVKQDEVTPEPGGCLSCRICHIHRRRCTINTTTAGRSNKNSPRASGRTTLPPAGETGSRKAQANDLKAQFSEATRQVAALNSQLHDLQLALATGQARPEAQQAIMAELHTYLKGKDASSSKENSPA